MKSFLILFSILLFSNQSFAQKLDYTKCWSDKAYFQGEFKLQVDPMSFSTSEQVFHLLNSLENNGFQVAGVRSSAQAGKMLQDIGIFRLDAKSQQNRNPRTGVFYPEYLKEINELMDQLTSQQSSIIKVNCVPKSGGSVRVGG